MTLPELSPLRPKQQLHINSITWSQSLRLIKTHYTHYFTTLQSQSWVCWTARPHTFSHPSTLFLESFDLTPIQASLDARETINAGGLWKKWPLTNFFYSYDKKKHIHTAVGHRHGIVRRGIARDLAVIGTSGRGEDVSRVDKVGTGWVSSALGPSVRTQKVIVILLIHARLWLRHWKDLMAG